MKAPNLSIVLAITLMGPSAAAQDVVPLARLSGSIVFDGLSDEPAWQLVAPLPMTVYTPTFGAPLSERTEIRVAYDDGGRIDALAERIIVDVGAYVFSSGIVTAEIVAASVESTARSEPSGEPPTQSW